MAHQMSFEGLVLVNAASDSFADFYRERVRPAPGARLPASDLGKAYAAWAEDAGVPTISAKAVSTFMQANGHPQGKSSSIYYRDAILGDFAGKPMPARALPVHDARPVREAINVTVDDLDQIIGELQAMRRRLARIMPASGNGRG